ncbi:GntR family transcriptional regulator [Silvimonas sp. JCM 19000]
MKKLSAVSLYQQVQREVLTDIEAGVWQSDEALPSEQELAGRFGVSQGTVRKALDGLVTDGVLYRRQGVGTFVQAASDDLGELRFSPPNSFASEIPRVELLSCTRIHAAEQLADIFGMRRGAAMWQVRRLLRVQGDVIGVEESLLPEAVFPDLDVRRLREARGNLRTVCWLDYGVRLKTTEARFRAVPAGQVEARQLQIDVNEPVLQLTRLARDFEAKPQVWSVAWFRSEQYAMQAPVF